MIRVLRKKIDLNDDNPLLAETCVGALLLLSVYSLGIHQSLAASWGELLERIDGQLFITIEYRKSILECDVFRD